MELTLREAAQLVNGQIVGNPDLVIRNLAKIEEAKEGDLTFLYLGHYEKYYPETKASAIIIKSDFKITREDLSYIIVEDPNKAFFHIIINYCTPKFELPGIAKSALIHPEARLGENVTLGENVVISKGCVIGKNVKIFHNSVLHENVSVGDDSLIFSNVTIREDCIVGKRAILHPGVVIGADGFGFYQDENEVFQKIPQIGNVVLKDDVELGANTCIDRASIGSTVIERGVKLDNLVQIAHNVTIGEDTVISSQTGVSGSAHIGKHCMIAGQVGIVGHIDIADRVIIIAQSGVSKGIPKAGKYFGAPAKEWKQALRIEGHIRNLPDYAAKIESLEKQIKELKEKL